MKKGLIKNMKIKNKILFTTLILSTFILLSSITGSYLLMKMSGYADTMFSRTFTSMQYLKDLKYNLSLVRTKTVQMISDDKLINAKKFIGEIDEIGKENDKLIEKFNSLITIKNEKVTFEQFKQNLLKYRESRKVFYDFAVANNTEKMFESIPKMVLAKDALDKSLERVIVENMNAANDLNNKSDSLSKTASLIITIVSIILLLISILISIRLTTSITNRFKGLINFVNELKSLDFRKPIVIKNDDEIGDIGKALNQMVIEINQFIKEVQLSIESMSASSEELFATSEEVLSQSNSVSESSGHILKGITQLTDNIQNVTVATDNVVVNINKLNTDLANNNLTMRNAQTEATEIKDKGNQAADNALKLFTSKSENAKNAIESGKVVKQISQLTKVIASVADTTNMLSLNASIEAARVGEAGRGFLVVANEIKKLAQTTNSSVINIQQITSQVEVAFDNLTSCVEELLQFVGDDVKHDYELMINVASRYDSFANNNLVIFEECTKSIVNINNLINSVNASMQNISAMTEETNATSETITSNIKEVAIAINDVSKSAESQSNLAVKLTKIIERFKI